MIHRWLVSISVLLLAVLFGIGIGRWTTPQPATAAADLPNQPAPAALESSPLPTREITASDFEVIRVIDGDTFKVRYDGDLTSVRILDINTPERGEPGAAEAADELRRLIEGKVVYLDFAAARRRDNFGRLLCRVLADGRDVGQHLLDAGLASPYRPGPRKVNAEN